MKKVCKIGLVAVLMMSMCLGAAACTWEEDEGEKKGDYVETDHLAQLTGSETQVNVLYTPSMGLGAGYADQLIPKRETILTNDRVQNGYNEVAQYFVTKALYNYNVETNKVRLNYIDWGWDTSLAQKMTTAFLDWQNGRRADPDVIIGESQMRSYAEQGLLQAFPQELEDWVRENMVEAAYKDLELEDKDGDGKGEIYGCSMDASPQVLLWNKTLLRQCDFDETFVQNGPKTWQEWIDAEEKIATTKGFRKEPGGIYSGENTGGLIRLYPFIEQAGGKIKKDDGTPDFNNNGTKAALELVRELSSCNLTEYVVTPQDENEYYFAFGERSDIVYATGASYQAGIWVDSGNKIEDLGYCRLPVRNASDTPTTNLIAATYLAVPNWNTTNAEKAFEVIKSHFVDSVQDVVIERDFKTTNRKGMEEKVKGKTQELAYDIISHDKIVYMPSFRTADTMGKLSIAQNKAALYDTYGTTAIDALLAEAMK